MYTLNIIKRMILEGEFLQLAKKVLLRPFKFEWRRNYRRFSRLYDNSQWDDAIAVGELIVQTKSKNKDFFQKLAICYIKVHKNHEAEYYMKKSLELRTRKNTEDIITTIENTVFRDKQNISSKYLYLGGRYNLGLIEHRHKEGMVEKTYLTKIIPNKFAIKIKINRERFFNQTICERFSKLQMIRPKMINCSEMKREKIYLMSFDKINDDKIGSHDFQEIIEISENIIGGIKYDDAIELLNIVDGGKDVPLSALIHRFSTHEFLLSYMKNKIKDLDGNSDLNKILDRIKYIIIDLKMYEKINPKKDYTFCHRDFHKNNILYDREEKKYYVIDWVNYGLALEGSDLVRFFMSHCFTFKEIKEEYFDRIHSKTEDHVIKKIFLTYDLIILWIGVLNKDNLQEQINNCISPAIQYMEELVEKKGEASEET